MKRKFSLALVKVALVGFVLGSLSSCQPIGYGDPLDQDAFVTESAPVVPVGP
jgi:hypothetical protein